MKYKLKPNVEALQLRWDNWSEMCEFADVGLLENGRPEGCYPKLDDLNIIGLRIPFEKGYYTASMFDYIVKDDNGKLRPVDPHVFEAVFEKE